MTIRLSAIILLVVLARGASATETVAFSLDPARSSYSFFAPPEGPGIPGCSPDDYRCNFGLTGQIAISLAADRMTAKIIGGDVIATGNEGIFGQEGFNITSPGSALLLIDLERIHSDGDVLAFRDSRFREQGINPYTILVELDGELLTIGGGVDLTALDGDGFELSMQAVRVPEPSLLALVCLGLASRAPRDRIGLAEIRARMEDELRPV